MVNTHTKQLTKRALFLSNSRPSKDSLTQAKCRRLSNNIWQTLLEQHNQYRQAQSVHSTQHNQYRQHNQYTQHNQCETIHSTN